MLNNYKKSTEGNSFSQNGICIWYSLSKKITLHIKEIRKYITYQFNLIQNLNKILMKKYCVNQHEALILTCN